MFNPILSQAAQRRRVATELQALPLPQRIARVRALCIDTGGTLIEPADGSKWGPVYPELHLMGLFHNGDDLEACIANWTKAALRAAPISTDDPAEEPAQ